MIDSSTWTGLPSRMIRDEYGVSDADYAAMAADFRRLWRRNRLKALVTLWGPAKRHQPGDRRKGWTVYDGHERNRDEEWTWWRAILATIAIITGRDHGQAQVDRHGYQYPRNIGYFDSGPTYGGYDAMVIALYPRCRISIFSDGECLM